MSLLNARKAQAVEQVPVEALLVAPGRYGPCLCAASVPLVLSTLTAAGEDYLDDDGDNRKNDTSGVESI